MKERNYGLDLLRVVLCISVITLHSYGYFAADSFHASVMLPMVLIAADGLFYMLSGYFNLEKEFKDVTDIKKFYKNKILYVLFPFLAFNFVWMLWDYIHLNQGFSVLAFLGMYYESMVNSAANGHMWFMYPLFGLLLSTPFLSKMLHSMDEKELKLVWRIAIGFNFLVYYLCEDFGMHFRVLCWVLDGWVIYYFAGYYYRHVVVKENKYKWFVLGVLGFVVTLLGTMRKLPFFTNFVGANDIQPMFTLFCLGYLFTWGKYVKIKNKDAKLIIGFLSRNTYLIYLYHMRGIEYAVRKLAVNEPGLSKGIQVVVVAFLFSLIAAFVTNMCMKPVQKFIDKKWVIKKI